METFRALLADPAFWAIMSAIAAFVAVPIAVLALMSSHRTAHRMVQIEEARDLAAVRQASKAMLVGRWEAIMPPPSAMQIPTSYRLTVTNQGTGYAKRIRVAIDGEDVTNQTKAPLDADGRVSQLAPEAVFKISLGVTGHFPSRGRRVRVEWEDGSGEPGIYESEL